MSDHILLADPRVQAVPLCPCGEPFVDLLVTPAGLSVDTSRRSIGNRTPYYACVRKRVAQMLENAQGSLPATVRLLIKEGFRPVSLQKSYFNHHLIRLAGAHPGWTTEQLILDSSGYLSPPWVAPHPTGGAVDLTLVDRDGVELEMGTSVNADPFVLGDAIHTSSSRIPAAARENRQLLVAAMQNAGFVNYPTEWWHWSYGERYWALSEARSWAIYEPIDVPMVEDPTAAPE